MGGIAAASVTVVIFGTTAYQLWNFGMDIWENNLAKFVIPNSNGYIIFDPALCTGCQTCEVVCTTFNNGKSSLTLSRIQVVRDPFKPDLDNFTPTPCVQCKDPSCIKVCPVSALRIDYASGTNARIIDETACIGCRKCIEACGNKQGVSRIRFDEERENSLKCHLCYGEPTCVKYCSNGALRFVSDLPNEVLEAQYPNQAVFMDEREKDIPRSA